MREASLYWGPVRLVRFVEKMIVNCFRLFSLKFLKTREFKQALGEFFEANDAVKKD